MAYPITAYRPRLVVYVVWHPEFERGQPLAAQLYCHLARDAQAPTTRGIGIPVFFRSAPGSSGTSLPRVIPMDDAQHVAVIVLVDDHMVDGAGWDNYIKDAWHRMYGSEAHVLIPVSLSANAYNLDTDIEDINFVRLHETAESEQVERLKNRVTHELCRLLMNQPQIADVQRAKTPISAPPVSLFISHARLDGLEIATTIRDYVHQNLSLKTFFDANDIAPGSLFYAEINANIERTALIVVQTDAYCSREWCQHEVLWAKRNQRPLVVVHAIDEGERRSFPYNGNTPTIRWKPAEPKRRCEQVVGLMLTEVLRYEYFGQHFEDIWVLWDLPADILAIPFPPELFTYLVLRQRQAGKPLLVYPDPPLGAEELRLLAELDPELKLTTPIMLPVFGSRA